MEASSILVTYSKILVDIFRQLMYNIVSLVDLKASLSHESILTHEVWL